MRAINGVCTASVRIDISLCTARALSVCWGRRIINSEQPQGKKKRRAAEANWNLSSCRHSIRHRTRSRKLCANVENVCTQWAYKMPVIHVKFSSISHSAREIPTTFRRYTSGMHGYNVDVAEIIWTSEWNRIHAFCACINDFLPRRTDVGLLTQISLSFDRQQSTCVRTCTKHCYAFGWIVLRFRLWCFCCCSTRRQHPSSIIKLFSASGYVCFCSHTQQSVSVPWQCSNGTHTKPVCPLPTTNRARA